MSYDLKDYQDTDFLNIIEKPSDYRAHNRKVQFEWSPKICWWLLPTVEINTSMQEVTICFLCLSCYITWRKI